MPIENNKEREFYAFKTVHKVHSSEEAIENLMNEDRILIKLNHPFIIQHQFKLEGKKRIYLAMEYCPGGDLFEAIS